MKGRERGELRCRAAVKVFSQPRPSDFHDLFFFVLAQFGDPADVLIGQLLHFVETIFLFIFGNGLVLERFFEFVIGIAADVASRGFCALRPFR